MALYLLFPRHGEVFAENCDFFSSPNPYLTPLDRGSPWNWVTSDGLEETIIMGLYQAEKSLTISLAFRYNTRM